MYRYFDSFDSGYDNNSVRYLCTPSEFTRNNFLYVQECGELHARRNKTTKRKDLKSYLIAYVLDGTATLSYDSGKYILNKDDVFFIDCKKYHLYETPEDNPWSVAWVHFYGNSSKAYYDTFKESFGNCIHIEKNYEIAEIIKRIIATAKLNKADSEVVQNFNLCHLLTELITIKEQNKRTSMDHIVSYINSRFTEKITLDDISSRFYISKFHLSRSLKAFLGVNFSEYLISKRIGYAKELLRFSDKSIEEIAYMTGIGTPSHFIYVFKKAEGITPLSFRNKWAG